MNREQMERRLQQFLEAKGVAIFTVNGKVFVKKENFYKAMAQSIEDTLQQGDIEGESVFDEARFLRFLKANELSEMLFTNIASAEMECMPNLSFASATIMCEHFGFDVERIEGGIKSSNKQVFEEFIQLVDFIQISPINSSEISVTFTVNNVYREAE